MATLKIGRYTAQDGGVIQRDVHNTPSVATDFDSDISVLIPLSDQSYPLTDTICEWYRIEICGDPAANP
ncbi:hypothetical protein CPT_Maja_006 [Burkholderia phage Maja]|uniref:Uncharacterized protein n=1 Tax=Burkholderia phage Maja TaxID=2767571 RepID=A0A7S6U347_9CAUD|nr:hypothetical protein CPT_Maja_006 [Burkholderia phage Maja]